MVYLFDNYPQVFCHLLAPDEIFSMKVNNYAIEASSRKPNLLLILNFPKLPLALFMYARTVAHPTSLPITIHVHICMGVHMYDKRKKKLLWVLLQLQ